MSDDTGSVEEIVRAALKIDDPVERAEFIRAAGDGDAALLRRVERLLRENQSEFETLGEDDTTLGEWFRRHETPSPGFHTATTLHDDDEDAPGGAYHDGDQIGRYRLLQQIGEGGFGAVFMAEQSQPVKRRVALKVIKLGMDTRQIVARFEAERQALALMDHPNIAKVLDAGTTESGRPYFVMELIRGIRITKFCDEAELSVEERLELFLRICSAIQHAHQKGVIHRDIKPSNVLVTEADGAAIPMVIDFGIAKAIGEDLTDKTVFTRFEQFLGTPAYTSPEQAGMSGVDIDTRSDIYTLGVLLYELLAGEPPFDHEALMSDGFESMRRTIKEIEPARPSTRLKSSKNERLNTLARQRQTNAPHLVTQLKGDLDWIVMKAMEKDRSRRYETANGLAMDVRRYLAN